MRVIRWKNAATGVESLTITATGIYFPVGKTDSSFIARYSMASAGQTASIERVSSPLGDRIGSPSINVSGTTEVVSTDRRGLSSGIAVTAISGTLNAILDDNTPITNWPDNSLGRFPAKEDLDAYVYGANVPSGLLATAGGVQITWRGAEVGWLRVHSEINTQMVGNECHMGTLGAMTSPGYDGRSYQLVRTLEGHAIGARVVIRNNEATPYTLDALSIAPSATAIAGTVAPSGAWVAVTFGGASNPTIPARLGVNRPSIIVSDVVYFSTLARTDGYDQPYIFIRGYNATGPKSGLVGSSAALGSRTDWGYPTNLNRGRIKWSASAVGNFVSSNQAGMSDDGGAFGSLCFEIQPIYSVPVLSVMGIGDSIISGDGASITGCGYGFRACADISTIEKPVSWTNYGFSNMTTGNFALRLTDAIAAGFHPSILVVPSFSPNDGTPTQALIDACKANLIRILDICRANNITPIIVTPAPRSYGAPEEAFRQSLCAWVRGLRGCIILDADKILASTPGGSAQDVSLCNDHIHPNDAGNDALNLGRNGAPGLKAILSGLATSYFG